MVTTRSDVFGSELAGKHRRLEPVLFLVIRGDDPHAPPSRHALGKIDVVRFGRGERAAIRETVGTENHLTLRVPDPTMSSQHAQLIAVPGGWRLDDPSSKNGAVVDGKPTRRASINYGQVVSLGHAVFLIERAPVAADGPLDVTADELHPAAPELATFDDALAQSLAKTARLAAAGLPVLLLGETGAGKEVIARALHELSGRPGPFVAVNCGGIPIELVESELFGHRRGAFSGAVTDRLGHVRAADGGTLFLDEIGELPATAQAALLRVLAEREVVPVGDSSPIRVDVRFCAATHRDLASMVDRGTFRVDLHARLAGATVALPPLRERRADLGILVRSLLRRRAERAPIRFTAAAAAALAMYGWPLNIRELERALTSAAALAPGGEIGLEQLPEPIAHVLDARMIGRTVPLLDDAERAEAEQLSALLRACNGNVAEVARRLDKDRTQVYRDMRRLGVGRNDD